MTHSNVKFAVVEKFEGQHEQELMKELKLHSFLLPQDKIKTGEVTVSFRSGSFEKRVLDIREFYIQFYRSGTKSEQVDEGIAKPKTKNPSIFVPNIRSLSCDLKGDTFSVTYWKSKMKTKKSMKDLISDTLSRGYSIKSSAARISRSSNGSAGSTDDTIKLHNPAAWPSPDSFESVTIKFENESIRNEWLNILIAHIETCAERLGDIVLGDQMDAKAVQRGADIKLQPPEVILRFQRHAVDLWFLAKQRNTSKVLESRKQLAELLDKAEHEAEACLWNELANEQEDTSERHPYIYFDPEDI